MNPMWLLAVALLLGCSLARAQFYIDKIIYVQPIHVGNGSIYANAGAQYFSEATNKIWAQAGIEIAFKAPQYYVNSTYYTNTSSSAGDTTHYLGQLSQDAALYGGIFNADPRDVRLFFVDKIDNNTSVYGYTIQSTYVVGQQVSIAQNNVFAIAQSAITTNRIDVIAHELGHVLSLDHQGTANALGATGAYNLMSTTRTVPSSVSGITTSGVYDVLTTGGGAMTSQVDRALAMAFADAAERVVLPNPSPHTYNPIPEPAQCAVITAVAVLLACLRRRFEWRR